MPIGAKRSKFFVYLPSIGTCSSTVTVAPRVTGRMTYNTQFSGSVSLYGSPASWSGSNTYLYGTFVANVR